MFDGVCVAMALTVQLLIYQADRGRVKRWLSCCFSQIIEEFQFVLVTSRSEAREGEGEDHHIRTCMHCLFFIRRSWRAHGHEAGDKYLT